MDPSGGREALARRLERQSRACATLGSTLYEHVLSLAAEDAIEGGIVASVLEGHEQDPGESALALRLMAAAHRLVLEGRAPELAAHYPSAGGDSGREGAWEAFRSTLERHRDEVRRLVSLPVQTNEVGRSAALLGGFLVVASKTGLPLRVLEIGASGGLNLRWDRYRYEHAGVAWGDPGSPVVIRDFVSSGTPPLSLRAEIAERAGCDPFPVDPSTEEGRVTLLSYVWADQTDRLGLFRGAFEVAASVPAPVERAGAAAWLERWLARPAQGAATVLFHSITMQYLEAAERRRVFELIAEAGARATVEAPFAWLRMEPAGPCASVVLTRWPEAIERVIATAHYHGRPVRWLQGELT